MFSSLPRQRAPRKNVKNDNDLKTSPRQAAWKKWPEKRRALDRKREHLCRTYLFSFFYLGSHLQWEQPVNFGSLLKICRLLVFPNISQRFDSISGMLSMTLVWNQRTTLENEGGGKKKKEFQGGATGARQSTGWGGSDFTAGPAPLKTVCGNTHRAILYPHWIKERTN